MCIENRKYARFRAKSELTVTVLSEDSSFKTEGILLNISQGGAYVLADSIPFETATIRFESPNAAPLVKNCARIDTYCKGAQGMAVQFSNLLAIEELELLMESGIPASETEIPSF